MVVSAVPYDYTDVKLDPAKPKADGQRPPHPVTMMIKRVLMAAVDLLELPPNPLDQLTHLCGGREVVAEMTGRTEMMECQPDGSFLAVKRARDIKQQELNITVRPAGPAAAVQQLIGAPWGPEAPGCPHQRASSALGSRWPQPSSRRSPGVCRVHQLPPTFHAAHVHRVFRLHSISAAA